MTKFNIITHSFIISRSNVKPIWLGNIEEINDNIDLGSLIPSGSYAHACVTITGFTMSNNARSGGNNYRGRIVSVELID